jgi:hypothetical protein
VLLGLVAGLILLRWIVLAPRLRRVGSPTPGVDSLATLLQAGCYDGVPVAEEPSDLYGGGRYLPSRGEIRLAGGMLARNDVDALMILAHERGHAAGDLPAPRPYRLTLLAAFLIAFALGWNGRLAPSLAAPVMAASYALAAAHVLRNEWAASRYAWRLAASWSAGLRREAFERLGAAFGIYLCEWGLFGLGTVVAVALLSC